MNTFWLHRSYPADVAPCVLVRGVGRLRKDFDLQACCDVYILFPPFDYLTRMTVKVASRYVFVN